MFSCPGGGSPAALIRERLRLRRCSTYCLETKRQDPQEVRIAGKQTFWKIWIGTCFQECFPLKRILLSLSAF